MELVLGKSKTSETYDATAELKELLGNDQQLDQQQASTEIKKLEKNFMETAQPGKNQQNQNFLLCHEASTKKTKDTKVM